ncbi:MAG: hypothetical protein ABJO67_02420 [Pseudoruegeria sp.]
MNIIREIADHIQVSLIFAAVILLGFGMSNTTPISVDEIVMRGLPKELLAEARPPTFKENIGVLLVTLGTLFLVAHWLTNPFDVIKKLFGYDENREIFEDFDSCGLIFVVVILLVAIEMCCLFILFNETVLNNV